jgi:Cof subfamily protein (haloacid dehalogenase superfamily)
VVAFACDLDRTLIAADVTFRPRTGRAIGAAREAGMHVIIVTGRMYQSAVRYAREAGLTEPLVCYQGAVVADPRTGEFLRHVPIPLAQAREAIAAVEAEGFPLNVYVDDELYVARESAESDAYANFQQLAVHPVGNLLEWLDRPPTKLVCVGDPLELDALEGRLKARFDGRLFISKSLPYFLELAEKDVTKGSGLEFVAQRLGFTREQTVAFGDGENDVELLEWAGYAVAVANAHRRLLGIADYVCPSVDEEGVAQVIEAYLAGPERGSSRPTSK